MSRPIRLTVVNTHPIQYQAPWFRFLADHCPELELQVLYASQPTPGQQGAGFDTAFTWDTDVLSGYSCRILRPPANGQRFDTYRGVDVPGIAGAIAASKPDVVLVPGWNSVTLVRAIRFCRRNGIPLLYRGDTHLGNRPSGWKGPLWVARNRRRLHHFDGWLSVGRRVHRFLRYLEVPEERIAASPHCVDNAFFATRAEPWQRPEMRAQLRRELGLAPEGFNVLFCGKLQPKKRPAEVIEAVARLAERSPEHLISLLVAGSGEQETALRELAARRGIHAVWRGFVNQSELPRLYAAADCLALPSDWGETWGLVVNEALATGLPCAVSDRVGCAPDLVTAGETGEVFRFGDVDHFTAALHRILAAQTSGHDFAPACRRRAEDYSYARASEGLLAACQMLLCAPAAPERKERRVLACCGGMVVIFGLERSVFDILGVLRADGAAVHCVLNSWEYAVVAEAAERIGATWATGYYRHRITRRLGNLKALGLSVWDMLCTSAQLVREVLQFRPTHILIPEYSTALRNAPALLWCRARGIPVIFPVGNTPGTDRFHRRLWRRVLNPLIDRFIGVSRYVERELLACGLPPEKVGHAPLTAALRASAAEPVAEPVPDKDCSRVIYVGQINPLKGVHLLLDAISLLRARGFAVTLDVVGPMDGWIQPAWSGYREALRERASQPGLQGAVFFLGEREDVPALLARAGIHCCPSLPEQQEALGLVNLEAKQAGTPSVVFPTGALPELIEHARDGWVCRDCSAEALADGVEFFLADRVRCLAAGQQARRSAGRFTRESFTREWLQQFG